MIPTYHLKTEKQVKRVWDIYYSPRLAGWSPVINYPHKTFSIVCDANPKFVITLKHIITRLDGKKSIGVHAELPEGIAKYFGLEWATNEDELSEHDKQAATVYIQIFSVMLEYGVIKQERIIKNVTPANRQEKRRIEREQAFNMMVTVLPHSHAHKVIRETGLKRQEPYFMQTVRSHVRRLKSGAVVTVKEHHRYKDKPERPIHYNVSRMAQKSEICKVCL